MKKHYRHENDCLNCGTELHGKYCHACGQENLQIKESFGHMITHAVADYFHFDHQFFHTLKPLFFSPGKLTNEYMAGRRVQYLHPVKMYIFISLVYFVLLFSHSSGHKPESDSHGKQLTAAEMADSANHVKKGPVLTEAQKKAVEAELNKIAAKNGGKIDTSKRLQSFKTAKLKNGKTDTTYVFETFYIKKDAKGELDTTYTYNGLSDLVIASTDDATYEDYLKRQEKLPEDQRENFLERYFTKKAFSWKEKGGATTQKMIEEGVKHNAPKMMFLLLPLFALMLKVSFYKNNKFYVEHLIYSFHFHCFLFLFLTILMLTKMVVPDTWLQVDRFINFAGLAGVFWYFYRSLRVVYKRSIFRTITKTVGISITYLITLSISLIILVLITAIFEV